MNFDLIIIGSGPGGYVAAIRASQLGLKTAVIEKAELGGICLNWGCIPTKSLLKSATVYEYIKHSADYGINVNSVSPDFNKVISRSREVASNMSKGVQYLLKKNGVEVVKGYGKIAGKNSVSITGEDGNTSSLTAGNIIIATGSRSKEMPILKQDGKKIIGYREALSLPALPESMIIAGSGAIGCEFAYFYNTMGTKVTLIELLPGIAPLEDEEVSKQLARSFKKTGIQIFTDSKITGSQIVNDKCEIHFENKGNSQVLQADVILSAVGVSPNIENTGLEESGIIIENGKIKVDRFYKTNVDGIYAIGDVVHGPALAHVASAEGIICVEKIAGKNPLPLNYGNIPGCIYTVPEVASVGMTEKEAREKYNDIKVGKFPYTASGKASAAGNKDGFVKLIFDSKYGELLGAHLIGLNVTEMISELVVARNLETTGHEIIKSVHPHPTMSEAIMEAAAAAYGEVIHL